MSRTTAICFQLMLFLVLAASQRTFAAAREADGPDASAAAPILRVWLPRVTMEDFNDELAIRDPARTAGWVETAAPGLALRTPPAWQRTVSDELMLGYRSITVLPPICAGANRDSCIPPGQRAVPLVRASVLSLRPAEARPSAMLMASLQEFGYTKRSVRVQGAEAWIMEPGPLSLPGSDIKIILPRDQHEYMVELPADLASVSGDSRMLGLLLGTLRVDSATAPPAPEGELAPVLLGPMLPVTNAPQSVQTEIARNARLYGDQHTNADSCYINLFANCSFAPPYADGAHFIDCVLWLSGVQLMPTSCQGENSVVGNQDLYNRLIARGAQPIARSQVRPGDLVFISDRFNRNCWAGPVTAINVATLSGFYFAVHSIINTTPPDTSTADPFRMVCTRGVTPSYEYIRVVPDTIAPTVAWQITSPVTSHVDVPIQLSWLGDDQDGSGVDTYVLRSFDAQGQETILYQGPDPFFDMTPRAVCAATDLTIQALDGVGNPSPQLPLQLITTLPGDANLDGSIGQDDLQSLLRAWVLSYAGADPPLFLDMNGDAEVEAGDMLWLRGAMSNSCQ